MEAAAPCGRTDAAFDVRGDISHRLVVTRGSETETNPGRNLRAAVVEDEIADPVVLLAYVGVIGLESRIQAYQV